jgi:hypothetical protein
MCRTTPARNRFHLAWLGLNGIPPRHVLAAGHTTCSESNGFDSTEGTDMAKYLIAWILGVPAIVLVLIYLLF